MAGRMSNASRKSSRPRVPSRRTIQERFLRTMGMAGVESSRFFLEEPYGAGSAPRSPVCVRWIHRDARRLVRRQEDGARQRTQLEWLLCGYGKPLPDRDVPGDKAFHRERIF